MTKILVVDSSINGAQSLTRSLTQGIVDRLKEALPHPLVVHYDLNTAPLSHLSSEHRGGADAEGVSALGTFMASDIIVIGAPMYNFSIPSTLKAWFDRIIKAGTTFQYQKDGTVAGLAGNKRIIVAYGRHGRYGTPDPFNFHDPYVRCLFAFIGIPSLEEVYVEGSAKMTSEERQEAINTALEAWRP